MSAAEKNKIRSEINQCLAAITFPQLIQKSQDLKDIFEKFLLVPCRNQLEKDYIISYYPFDTEPQINLEIYGLKLGYVRILNWKNATMESAEARRDIPGQWVEVEPEAGVQIYQPALSQSSVPLENISVIMVPALAFDSEGRRLGRGKGFYDRYLKSVPGALRVGVAFEEQILKKIEEDSWDERVDVILTDKELIETPRFSSWKNHGIVKR